MRSRGCGSLAVKSSWWETARAVGTAGSAARSRWGRSRGGLSRFLANSGNGERSGWSAPVPRGRTWPGPACVFRQAGKAGSGRKEAPGPPTSRVQALPLVAPALRCETFNVKRFPFQPGSHRPAVLIRQEVLRHDSTLAQCLQGLGLLAIGQGEGIDGPTNTQADEGGFVVRLPRPGRHVEVAVVPVRLLVAVESPAASDQRRGKGSQGAAKKGGGTVELTGSATRQPGSARTAGDC